MKKNHTTWAFFLVFAFIFSSLSKAQTQEAKDFFNQKHLIFFKGDSLNGFPFENEFTKCQQLAQSPRALNEYTYLLKQKEAKFVKQKYHIDKLAYEIAKQNLHQQNAQKVISEQQQQMYRQNNPPHTLASSCNNLDFEDGNFGNWVGYEGYNESTTNPLVNVAGPLGPPPTNLNNAETSCQYFAIISNGSTDPNMGIVLTSPLGGNCARMGGENRNLADDNAYTACADANGYGVFNYSVTTQCVATYFGVNVGDEIGLEGSAGEVLETTFTVSAQNSAFQYAYLFAYADNGSHDTTQQPYFKVRVLDHTGQEINCLNYFQQGLGDACGNTHAPPGYSGSLASGLFYTSNWQTSSLNLLPYIGQQVTVIFTVAGCTVGGHFGYAYVDCACAPQEIIIPFTSCIGANTTLIAPPLGGAVYQWTTPNGNIVSGATTNTVTVNQSGTYSVTITPTKSSINGAGNLVTQTLTTCSYELDTTITLYPNPTLTVNSTTICAGGAATLTANSTGSAGTLNYTWNPAAGFTFTNAGDSTAVITPASTKSYTVTGTSVHGCTNTAVATVTVNPNAPATFLAPADCNGTSTTFTNTTVGGSIYFWNFGDLTTLADTSLVQNPSYSYPTSGSYVVSLTVTTAAGCTSNTTQTITVNPQPTATISALPVCLGTTTAFTSTITNGNTYMWDYGDPVGNPVAGTTTPTHLYATANTFPVTVTVTTTGGCTVTATTNAIVNALPTSTISVQPVCLGTSSVFTSIITSGNAYNWDFGGAGAGSNITTATPTYTYSAANTFPVTLTVTAAGGCTVTATTNAVVNPLPVVSPIPNSVYCPNQLTNTINFTCTPTGGVPVFTWVGLGGVGITQTGNIAPFTTVNTTSLSIVTTITVNATLNGCQGPNATFSITVFPNPTAKFKYKPHVCVGTPLVFTDESTVGGGFSISSWNWDMNGDGIIDDVAQNPQYVIATTGADLISLEVGTNSIPSCTAQVTEAVYVNPKPVINFIGADTTGCSPLSTAFFDLSSISTGTIVSWNWNFGNGQTSTSQHPPAQKYTNNSALQPAYYSVLLTVTSDSGCVASKLKSDYIEVYPTPIANFSWGPTNADITEPTITFVNEAIGYGGYPMLAPTVYGPNGIEYDLGDATYSTATNPNYVYNTGIFNHAYNNPDPNDVNETYNVTQWVVNNYGCKDSITKPVEILPIFDFYIPNAFSPNGDHKNEGFKGLGIGIDNTTYNLWIFDRWGLMIYHAQDIDAAWDGHMLGHQDKPILQQDVYVWKVKFNDVFGTQHNYHGTVTLLK